MLRFAIGFCDEIVWIWTPTLDGLRLVISNQYLSLDSKLEMFLDYFSLWRINEKHKTTTLLFF